MLEVIADPLTHFRILILKVAGNFIFLTITLKLIVTNGSLPKMTKLFNQPSAGIVVFVALFLWENKKEEEQLSQITRDETLSRLPLRLSTNRVVELVQLRDTVRPVSTKGFLYLYYLCLRMIA